MERLDFVVYEIDGVKYVKLEDLQKELNIHTEPQPVFLTSIIEREEN